MSKEKVWIACPDCGFGRDVDRNVTRRPWYTGRCRSCANKKRPYVRERRLVAGRKRAKAFRNRYPTGTEILPNGNKILWDSMKIDTKYGPSMRYVQVYCKPCDAARWVRVSDIRSYFTGYCRKHWANAELNRGPNHPNFRDGKTRHPSGHIFLRISALSPEDQRLALQMGRYDKGGSIPEHRLVMARHLGRPLAKYEHVHHKNGIRDDNRRENLELRTIHTHGTGHGEPYYQLWQEALSENGRLKARLAQVESVV